MYVDREGGHEGVSGCSWHVEEGEWKYVAACVTAGRSQWMFVMLW